MNFKIACITSFLLLLSGCEGDLSPGTEEPKVYRALLIHLGAEKAERLVIRADSVSDRVENDGFNQLNIEASDIKKSFSYTNTTSSPVPLGDVNFSNVTIVSKRELDGVFSAKSPEQNWKVFYRKYPKSSGIIGFSRVGFNADATKAVVYFEHVCGKLCGNGFIAYLERGLTGWEVERAVHLWVS